MNSKHADASMKHDILSAIRPFVFVDTCAKVSVMIDRYTEKTFSESDIENQMLRVSLIQAKEALASVLSASDLDDARNIAGAALARASS